MLKAIIYYNELYLGGGETEISFYPSEKEAREALGHNGKEASIGTLVVSNDEFGQMYLLKKVWTGEFWENNWVALKGEPVFS